MKEHSCIEIRIILSRFPSRIDSWLDFVCLREKETSDTLLCFLPSILFLPWRGQSHKNVIIITWEKKYIVHINWPTSTWRDSLFWQFSSSEPRRRRHLGSIYAIFLRQYDARRETHVRKDLGAKKSFIRRMGGEIKVFPRLIKSERERRTNSHAWRYYLRSSTSFSSSCVCVCATETYQTRIIAWKGFSHDIRYVQQCHPQAGWGCFCLQGWNKFILSLSLSQFYGEIKRIKKLG